MDNISLTALAREQLELAKEAIEAKREGKIQLCIEKDQASLALEDHPYVKLHLASCLQGAGKLVDALSHFDAATEWIPAHIQVWNTRGVTHSAAVCP